MRVVSSFKNLEKSEFLENILEKNLKRLERKIQIFQKLDPIHIDVHIEKNSHKNIYSCSLCLYLPQHVLRSIDTERDASLAINKSFFALYKQLDRLKYKIEKHISRKNF